VGELEAFVRAGAMGEEEIIEDAVAAPGETTARTSPPPEAGPSDTGTRISGTASKLNLPPGLRCALTVISGPDRGRKLAMEKPRVVVGRGSGDLQLTDEEVSTQHCAFEISGVTCTVKDLDSRNGTYVDGEKIQRATLGSVGEVMVGNTTILFTMTLDDTPGS
jgi:hypothetical protein